MKKYVSILLLIAMACSFTGCAFPTGPDFKDFSAYEADFSAIRDFLLIYDPDRSNENHFYIRLRDIPMLSDGKAEHTEALAKSADRLHTKGFSCVHMYEDFMVFWEDETKYYGVMWCENLITSIKQLSQDYRQNMPWQRLSKGWYETGVGLHGI